MHNPNSLGFTYGGDMDRRAARHKAGGLRAVGLVGGDDLGDGRSGESAGRKGKDRGSSETHVDRVGINMYLFISTRR